MPGKFVNPYAGNYSATSRAVGGAVQGVVDERRIQQENQRREEAHIADQERQALLKETQQLQLAKMKESTYESLNVVGDTGIKSADQHITSASRMMVDAQAANVAALKNGEIDTDEFAQKSATIKSQVPLLKSAKESLGKFQTTYADLIAKDQISGADSGQSGKLYQAIQDGTVEVVPDENGSMIFKSVDGSVPEGEEPIYMPLNSLDRLPTPTKKAPELTEIAKGPLAQIGDGEWNDAAVTEAVDKIFGNVQSDQEGQKLLRSFAVDQMDMTLEQANQMMAEEIEGDTGATNALEQLVEDAIHEKVRVQYDANKLQKETEERKLQVQKQIVRKNDLQIRGLEDPQQKNMTAAQQNYEFEQQNAAASYDKANGVVQRFINPDGQITNPENLSTSLNAFTRNGYSTEYNDGGWFGSGSMIIYDGEGNQIGEVDATDSRALQPWIAKITGVDASRLQEPQQEGPIKRLASPFRRLADFVSSPFKRDPEKKYGEKKTEVGEWEQLEDGRERRVTKTSQDWNQGGTGKSFSEAGVNADEAKAYWAANPEEYAKYKAGQQGTDVGQQEEFRQIQKQNPPPTPTENPLMPSPMEPQYRNASLTRPSAKQADGTRGSHGASYEDFKNISPEQMASLEKRAGNATSHNEARNLKNPKMLAKDRGWDINNLNPKQQAWIDKTLKRTNKVYEANKVTLTKS